MSFISYVQQWLSDLLYLVKAQTRFLIASTLKYHAADKYDTPPSHFKLTLGLAIRYTEIVNKNSYGITYISVSPRCKKLVKYNI